MKVHSWCMVVLMLCCVLLWSSCTGKGTGESVVEQGRPDAGAEQVQMREEAPAVQEEPQTTADAGEPTVPERTEQTMSEMDEAGGSEGSGGEGQREQPPENTTASKQIALVFASDYAQGSYSLIDVGSQQVLQKDQGSIHGDAAVAYGAGKVFVLNRFRKDDKDDSLDVYDVNGWKVVQTIALGKKRNPHHLVVAAADKVYVSLYGDRYVLAINPTTGATTAQIDLSSLVEESDKACEKDGDCMSFGEGSNKCDTAKKVCMGDGLPELSQMLLHGGKLYVLVQGLDRNQGFKPISSTMAVIDTSTDKLEKTIALKGSNPVAFVPEPGGTFLIVQVGSALDAEDGGLVRFDPAKGSVDGTFVTTEKDLGGTFAANGFAIVSSTLGYAIISDQNFKQSLVQFDPSTGKKGSVLLDQKSLGGLALTASGELYVADRTDPKKGGVRIFDANTGKETTTQPILTGILPPLDILLLPKP